jgi:hypothetical protein
MNYSTGWKAGTMSGIKHRSIFARTTIRQRPQSLITRRGKRLENGDTLWLDCVTGQLSIEKANPKVAQ